MSELNDFIKDKAGLVAMKETLKTLLKHFTKDEIIAALEELAPESPPSLGIVVTEHLGLGDSVG